MLRLLNSIWNFPLHRPIVMQLSRCKLPTQDDRLPIYPVTDLVVVVVASILLCMSPCPRSSSSKTLLQAQQRCRRSKFCRMFYKILEWARPAAKPGWEGQPALFSCRCSETFVWSWTCWHQHLPYLLILANTSAAEHTQMVFEMYYHQRSLAQKSFAAEPQYSLQGTLICKWIYQQLKFDSTRLWYQICLDLLSQLHHEATQN